jgi:methionyl-tRNA formyltransferase
VRFILCGKNDAAVAALECLRERGDEVLVVGAAGDEGRDGWQRSLRAAAARLGVPCETPRRIHEPQVIQRLADFGAHALVSIQYDQILRAPLFRALGRPCLNLHFALLPRHRGVAPIAWAILSGDSHAGVTLHHMVEAIDAGDVIAQRRVAIGPAMAARELYDEVSRAAVELFRESPPVPPPPRAPRRAPGPGPAGEPPPRAPESSTSRSARSTGSARPPSSSAGCARGSSRPSSIPSCAPAARRCA